MTVEPSDPPGGLRLWSVAQVAAALAAIDANATQPREGDQ